MDYKNKSVLITGAGGFIGSHLTERLVNMGAEVTAFVRYNSRNDFGLIELLDEETLSKINIVPGDLKDSEAIMKAAKGKDIIFHLGAMIAIPYSYIHPRETIDTNVQGTLNVLTAAKELDIEKIVHTSTSEVYGTAQYVPIDEKHPLNPQSPYAASKVSADHLAMSYHHSFDLPVATIRPFNTYGPRQSARAIIPTIISQALSSDTINLGALDPTRDLTYVADTVDGFIKVASSEKSIGEVINIGSNFDISIGDLAKKIAQIIGKDVEIKLDEKRIRPKSSEVERLRASNDKAKSLLSWEPEHSLDDGLKKTIDWMSSHLDLYKQNMYVV
ncbi:MAG: GDP-mannose 4,6-dehydratase [Thermoplasmata archaeon]|nr:GDP-mannose 4,6-dehydratase [Thermoplasmata archaeon]